MSEGSDSRIDRLGDAIDAYLRYRAEGHSRSEQDFLREHEELRDLLEPMLRTQSIQEDPARPNTTAGRHLGDYRLLRKIGHGGMGVVFEAEQISLGRRVALKILHPQLTFSPAQIERFRSEAATAARLRHPAIVPIHEVGEHGGVHYFAMELVDGLSLDKRLIRAGRLDPKEAADLVAQTGEALQCAHDHGLVHRDVKPHNILVAADGTVRLLDFGLAKDLGRASLSSSGALLGTVQYMSPEQVRLGSSAVDSRSDVFSLGVVLYEILTGVRPFTGGTVAHVMKAITDTEPRSVRSCEPRVPRDLAVICHKALEKETRHRYESAGEMAADLRRFLRIEPILARPAGACARALKLVRRRKLAATAVVLGISLFVVGPMVLATVIEHANRALAAEKTETEKERDRASSAIDQLVTLLDQRLARDPWLEGEYRTDLQNAVELCERYLAEAGTETGRRLEIARTLSRVAHIYQKLGHDDEALAAYRRGLGVLEGLVEEGPGALPRRLFLARLHQDCMGTLMRLRRFPEARLEMTAAVETYAGVAQDAIRVSDRDRAHAGLVAVHVLRGRGLLEVSNQLTEADRCFDLAMEHRSRIENEAELDPDLSIDVVKARTGLGMLQLHEGDPDAAARELQDVLREIDALAEQELYESALTFEKAACLYELGHAHMRLGRLDDAEKSFRESIELGLDLAHEYRGKPVYRHNLAACQSDLGNLLLSTGRVEQAEPVLRTGLQNAEALVAERPGVPAYLQTQANLGVLLAALLPRIGGEDALSESVGLLRTASDVQRQLVAEHPEVIAHRSGLGSTLGNLAAFENQRGHAASAVELAREAIAHQGRAVTASPGNERYRRFLALHHLQLAIGLVELEDHFGAAEAIERAVNGLPGLPELRLASARCLAGCAAIARRAEGIAPDRGEGLARSYGDRAMECLRFLVERAPETVRTLYGDPKLEPLRERRDFLELVGRGGRDE